jgi:hypothetical protein
MTFRQLQSQEINTQFRYLPQDLEACAECMRTKRLKAHFPLDFTPALSKSCQH